jgi:hypothetical protein
MYSNANRERRLYAKRNAAGAVRQSVMAVRVTDNTELVIKALAKEMRMSTSEYLARMIADYLVQVSRQRGRLPA